MDIKKSEAQEYAKNILERGMSKAEALAYALNEFEVFKDKELCNTLSEKIEGMKWFKDEKERILNERDKSGYTRWNIDLATNSMVYLASKCEAELKTKGITLPRITGLTTAVKELNTLYGLYNQQTERVEVTFVDNLTRGDE